jgi:glycosyltransferase involved in cell wall biosynthesis
MTGAPLPRVSVAMPTYRRGAWLADAVESVLGQTFTDFEVVLSDNGDGDEVQRLVTSYRDPRLRYRSNGGDIGPTANAVAAYRAGRAPLLTMLHDDDLWEPTLLERLVPPLEARSDLVAAFSDHWLMDGDGALLRRGTERNTRRWGRHRLGEGELRPFTSQALVDRAVPTVITTVFRRTAVDFDDVPAGIGTLYDLWFAYQLSRHGEGAWYVPERLGRHRTHRARLSAHVSFERELLFCYERWAAEPALAPLRPLLVRASGTCLTALGLGELTAKGGDVQQARQLLRSGASLAPSPRSLTALALSLSPAAARRARALVVAGRRLTRAPG